MYSPVLYGRRIDMGKKAPWYDNIEKAVIIVLFIIMTVILL